MNFPSNSETTGCITNFNATIIGRVDSIKNPLKGKIIVDKVGQVIIEDYINEPKAKIIINK